MAVVTLLALLVSIGRLPRVFSAGVDLERAHRYSKRGDPAKAIPLLERTVKSYPDAIDNVIDLAEAYEDNHQPADAAAVVNSLEHKMVTQDESVELQRLHDRIVADLPKVEDSGQ